MTDPRLCAIPMRKGPCGRPAVVRVHPAAKLGIPITIRDPTVRCVMHSSDAEKDADAFLQELRRMWQQGDFDHTRFVFPPDSLIAPAVFTGEASFEGAVFRGVAQFQRARFDANVTFDSAAFINGADFSGCRFAHGASFAHASFGARDEEELAFYRTVPRADFTNAVFATPGEVVFRQINQTSLFEFRLCAMGCNIDQVHFENVKWHREGGRLVLQDELDLIAWSRIATVTSHSKSVDIRARYGTSKPSQKDAGLIAVAYARLVKSFDERHNYDGAEDAFRGMMEMKRLNPASLPLNRLLRPTYRRFPVLAAVMRQVTILNLYRAVSYYGSSYARALLVLVLLLCAFAGAFAASEGLRTGEAQLTRQGWQALGIGLLATIEVATFQRAPLVAFEGTLANTIKLVESIVVPAQVAIFLLALRRRFKR